jgi:IS30 family transposase
MSSNELCKGKHLRIEDCLIIEYGFEQNYTLKELAERVKKDPTTISKEIKRNRFLRVSNKKITIYNHANTEEVALKQTCAIIAAISNARNVDL